MCVAVILCPQLQGRALTQLQVCTCEHRSLLLHPVPKQLTVHPRPRRGALPINHPLRLVSAEELNPFVISALFPPTPILLLLPCRAGSSWLPQHCASMALGTTGLVLYPSVCKDPRCAWVNPLALLSAAPSQVGTPLTWLQVGLNGARAPEKRPHWDPFTPPKSKASTILPFPQRPAAIWLSCSGQLSSLQHQEHCW